MAIDLVMEQVVIENELEKDRYGMHPGHYFLGAMLICSQRHDK